MKLRIEDITAEVRELAFAEPQDEANRLLEQGPIAEYRVERPIDATISYYRSGVELFFEGELDAQLRAVCARCAEPFATRDHRSFRYVLAPRAADGDEQADLRAEDLEFSFYEGEEVDLSPLIREQLLLGLPTRPLCQEDCKGLCPACGGNLNREQCHCPAPAADPRLSVLRSLKVQR